jgi:hypothetical protein
MEPLRIVISKQELAVWFEQHQYQWDDFVDDSHDRFLVLRAPQMMMPYGIAVCPDGRQTMLCILEGQYQPFMELMERIRQACIDILRQKYDATLSNESFLPIFKYRTKISDDGTIVSQSPPMFKFPSIYVTDFLNINHIKEIKPFDHLTPSIKLSFVARFRTLDNDMRKIHKYTYMLHWDLLEGFVTQVHST